ncbi:extracellular solute-binding protein [Paenibacillus barcinonensis]|uniref:Carbohydrate ABC transporter substrate-binding protein (CUT1 family) n=2 Tax=Paenibacillus barcinonensis TaxID=198119 RepID=A0A2V4VAY4_PAEBA|nr:extracellular solute-binding protein [Paenibacillus barcinonensis]PYE50172.1 carbohydrate ABC transporter substrate-binding protein (CUT1 family) [Paenibacillus barcinonensis]QKS54874.1 extracellular solute-binding protein [Paenibacillus barcinonensis]
MKMTKKFGSLAIGFVLCFVVVLGGCSSSDSSKDPASEVAADGRKAGENGFIANRDLKGRIFLENDGAQLPADQTGNPVALKIKEKTGMTLDWQSTGATDGLQELTVTLATGDLPDVIEAYLDHGGRPEMAVLLKGAREGLFTDLRPYLEKTKVLKKYLDPNFLPRDTRENVMFRPEFDGKVYFIHMNIPAEDTTDADRYHYRAGMWIRADIAEALKVDPSKIRTEDELYQLAVRIKQGNFKDNNGKPITPIGPRKWGGDIVSTLFKNDDFGNGTRFDVDKDGKVKHVAETDYALKQVEFVQKLLKEGLLDKEAFSMDGVRAEEGMNNGSYGIISYANIALDSLALYEKVKYLPMDQLENYKGETAIYEKEKSGSQVWAIPATTENPEQIVQFADYLASKEGKALWQYGIEGQDYSVKDGKYIYSNDVVQMMTRSPEKVKDVIPTFWGGLLGRTDMNNVKDFGELVLGQNSQPDKFKLMFELMNYGNPTYKYWDGYSAISYLSEVPEIEAGLKPVLDTYKDVLVKSFYAPSLDEAKKYLDEYRQQLKSAGVEQFEQYLQEKYDKDPGSVVFYMDATF